MNIEEVENYLVNEAKKNVEAAAFRIGDDFYTIGSNRLSESHFIADSRDIVKLLDIGWPEVFIHSHLNCSSEPSKTDLDMMNAWDFDWWIYSIVEGKIDDIWRRVQPKE